MFGREKIKQSPEKINLREDKRFTTSTIEGDYTAPDCVLNKDRTQWHKDLTVKLYYNDKDRHEKLIEDYRHKTSQQQNLRDITHVLSRDNIPNCVLEVI